MSALDPKRPLSLTPDYWSSKMSQFEFIFVLVSIVLGLGLANLLNGIARTLQAPWQSIDRIHLAFSLGMILAIFVIWWGMYRWQDHGQFEFGTFAVIGLYTSVFYSISVILYPRDGSVRTFDEVRVPLYVALILYLLLELAYYFAGNFSPASYYKYVWATAFGLFVTAAWARRPLFDALVVVFWFVLFTGWWFVDKLAT